MKKAYSKRAGTEVFALAPEQIAVFRAAGYETPTEAEAIADAGAVKLTPPESARAYVAFDFKTGEFFVRVRTCTLKGNEVGALVGEIVQAAVTKRRAETADPDRPKAEPTSAADGAAKPSALGNAIGEALKKALLAALSASADTPAPAATTEGEEVSP
jgi:hypothetical protein